MDIPNFYELAHHFQIAISYNYYMLMSLLMIKFIIGYIYSFVVLFQNPFYNNLAYIINCLKYYKYQTIKHQYILKKLLFIVLI